MKTMKKLNALLFYQGGRCFYCGEILDIHEASIDHVIPQSKGGLDDTDNLVICCKYANQAFKDYYPKKKMEILKQIYGQPALCKKIFPREEKPRIVPDSQKTANSEAKPESNAPIAEAVVVSQLETLPNIMKAYQLLQQAVDSLQQQGKEITSSCLKKRMLTIDSSFNEEDYGFRQFKKFLVQAQQDKIIILKAHKRPGNYLVLPAQKLSDV
jgi:hypothetical protein